MATDATTRRPRLLVVVAHPDDETFGCGSVLLYAAAAGAVTGVVCATRGEEGSPAPGVDVPAEGLGALRERELHDAAALLGVSEVVLLGYRDSGMDGEAPADSLVAAPPDDVVAAVRKAVIAFDADVAVTLDASDGHRDHARMREATLAAVEGLPVSVYLHCLPRSLMRRWLAHHAGGDAAAAYEQFPDLGTPDEQLTTVLDTSEHLPRRGEAIAAHRSQTSPFEGLPDDLREAFLGRDHLIRAVPAWDGGAPEQSLFAEEIPLWERPR
jgi:LmbE family N-acetylglucosaminyl deacetylase